MAPAAVFPRILPVDGLECGKEAFRVAIADHP